MTVKEATTLRAFYNNNMNMAKTGRVLSYDGSGIRYQLIRIREKTGLDPFDPKDLETLIKIKPKEGVDCMTSKEIAIIRELAVCSMNVSKTAINLSYHYSTLLYHLDRIYNKTGLDPRNFFDLVELLKRTADREE